MDYERQTIEVWKVLSSRIDRMLFIICPLVNLLICAVSSKACKAVFPTMLGLLDTRAQRRIIVFCFDDEATKKRRSRIKLFGLPDLY